MNPQELYLENGKPTGRFFCEECRIIALDKITAEKCCMPEICGCGAVIVDKYWTVCRTCIEAHQKSIELERFNKAEKIKESDYTGMVYVDGIGHNEGYFESTDELREYLFDEYGDEYSDAVEAGETPLHTHVWAADSRPLVDVCADDVIGIFTGDAYEEFEASDLAGVPELEAACKAFNALNTRFEMYEHDYKRAVVFDKPFSLE